MGIKTKLYYWEVGFYGGIGFCTSVFISYGIFRISLLMVGEFFK